MTSQISQLAESLAREAEGGQSSRREFRLFGTGPLVLEAWGENAVCLPDRDAGGAERLRELSRFSFIYYPHAPHRKSFPRPSEFAAVAQQECAKYGMRASYNWSNYYPDFDRVRVNYLCVQ